MKKFFLTLIVVCMTAGMASAQGAKQVKRVPPLVNNETKANDMAAKLMLSDDAKAKFVAIYKEYIEEMSQIRPLTQCSQSICSAMSDKEVMQQMESCMDARQKCLDTQKKYYGKLKSILNARQLSKVFCGKAGWGCNAKRACGQNFRKGARQMRQRAVCPGARNCGQQQGCPVGATPVIRK